MRTPIYLSFLLVIALAVLGWRNHRRTQDLRHEHERLVAQASAGGWLVDQRAPGGLAKTSRSLRPDPLKDAQEAANALIAYARELPFPDDFPAAERQRRVLQESERIQKLSGKQLKIVIEELRIATGIEDSVRRSMLEFTLRELAKTHPQDALELTLDAKISTQYLNPAIEMMEAWGASDPARARKWLDVHSDKIAEEKGAEFEQALIDGAVIGDPLLALQWFSASDTQSGVSSLIARKNLSPEQRVAFLNAFRAWEKTPAAEAMMPGESQSILSVLFFGTNNAGKISLTEVSKLWENARLSPEEVEKLSYFPFTSAIDPKESLEWYQWISLNLPEEDAARWHGWLKQDRSTSPPIEKWLVSQAAQTRESENGKVDKPRENDTKTHYPIAKAVPGKPGFVFSPYNNRIVDVRDLPPGSLVKDPSMAKGAESIFQVP